MSQVSWARKAADDLWSIRDYLARIDEAVARDQIERIITAVDWLLDFPAAGAPVGYRRWRSWRPRRTSYVLIYEPVRDGLRIVRVRHSREDWQPHDA